MNVAVVAHHHNRAEGTGGYTAQLVAGAAGSHDVTLYATSTPTPPPVNVRVVHVPAPTRFAYGTILLFPLSFASKRGHHDLVHAQGWVTNTADVVTAHIVLGAWREALRASGQAATGGERWLGGWVEGREAALMRGARWVIAPSERARADLERCYGRTSNVVVIPHGFPAPRQMESRRAARLALQLPEDVFLALYIGDPRKGLANAVAAVERVPNTHLLAVGPTGRDVLPNGGTPGARIHYRTVPDISRAFAAADALLHPTIYDTFGLTVAEAMAWGVPVIVSDAAGVSELIADGRSGLIVRGDLKESAAAALERLVGDAALRARLSAGGREVASCHGWDETIRRTLDVYQQAR